jgi:hypothetical protein
VSFVISDRISLAGVSGIWEPESIWPFSSKVLEDKYPQSGRQVAVHPLGVDLLHEVRQRQLAILSDKFKGAPK